MDCVEALKDIPDNYFDLANKRLEREKSQMMLDI